MTDVLDEEKRKKMVVRLGQVNQIISLLRKEQPSSATATKLYAFMEERDKLQKELGV